MINQSDLMAPHLTVDGSLPSQKREYETYGKIINFSFVSYYPSAECELRYHR
jgi:hypothetical protein